MTAAAATPQNHQSFSTVLFKLKDYKDFTYQEMVSTAEFHLDSIKENKKLQSALRTLVRNEDIPAIKSILDYCNKSGGLLGHRKDMLTDSVDDVLSTLSLESINKKITELQALQLLGESIASFPHIIIHQIISLSHAQRKRLLHQFQCTPLGTSIHTFVDQGAWSDVDLRPILEEVGYKLSNCRLQYQRNLFQSKDYVRAGTMVTLAIDIVLSDDDDQC